MNKDCSKVLITKQQIADKTKEIANKITADYLGEEVLMVCILRGAALFFADLVREVDLPVNFDFMVVSSYGAGTMTSGNIKIVKDISVPIEGKNVVIVEDVIDSGHTMKSLKTLLATRNPKSLKICSFLDKPSRREVDLQGDYVGFVIPNEFVVGYGLDYNERYRNLDEVCILKREIYE